MAIDLLIAMVINDLADEQGRNPSDILPEFLLSKTGGLLLDEKSKLWWDGPSYVEEFYHNEQNITPPSADCPSSSQRTAE